MQKLFSKKIAQKLERYKEIMFKVDTFRRNRMIRGKIFSTIPFTKKLYNLFTETNLLRLSNNTSVLLDKNPPYFLTAIPNPTTGIGHAFAEWNTGRIIAKICNLQFTYIPLPSGWDNFLMLKCGYVLLNEVLKIPNIRIIRLPKFDYRIQNPCLEINKIITCCKPSYPTLFVLSDGQNLYQHDLFLSEIKSCYFSSHSPSKNLLNKKDERERKITVAVHIRRGDVEIMRQNNQGNWNERYLELTFFRQLLEIVNNCLISHNYDVKFNIYSQGCEQDFSSLRLFNTHLFINYDQYTTINDMIYSDILILSPSGFSFMAGLISNGFKIAKYPWWHDIPDEDDWCRVSETPSQDYEKIVNKLLFYLNERLK
jgi:hypothetical protein